MKIKFLLAGLVLMSGVAFGQTPVVQEQAPEVAGANESQFKPSAGDVTFEVNFSPLGDNPLSINYLRGRLFLAEDFAARAGISLAYSGQNNTSIFTWALAPGVEKHFAGTNRLSPYVGAELVLAHRVSSAEFETPNPAGGTTTTRISGATSAAGANRGFFNFGINGVVGADFYVARHLYLGLETGLGINVFANSQVQTTVAGTSNVNMESGSAFQFGPFVNGAIRLGFVF